MTDWPEYESHKVVRAAKVVSLMRSPANPEIVLHAIVLPEGGAPQEFQCTQREMTMSMAVGGYAVAYPDGFKSYSPAKAFEEGYTLRTGQ